MKRRTFAVIVIAWVMMVMLGFIIARASSSGLPFDPSIWRDEKTSTANGVRQRMADHLIESRALIDKSRDEVVSMLGQPSPTEYFREGDLVYHLGPERGFISIDSEWLVLRLDDDGRVANSQIVRD